MHENPPKQVVLLTGYGRAGDQVPVIHEDARHVRARLLSGGTIIMPRKSPLGVTYFEEVQAA